MDLKKLCINARQRTPWEAIDLGIILARKWWPIAFLVWFIPAAIIFFSISLLIPDYFWLAYLVVWWLKPILDRGPLYVASLKLFGQEVGLADGLRQLPRLYKTDFFAWLTYRRFSLTRSFDMPLTVLEQLRGRARSSRISVLHRRYGGVANWLTILCLHIEMFLIIGFMSFLMLMVPDNIEINFVDLVIDDGLLVSWLYHVSAFLAMSLVAAFYVICGFCLYISRRIDLEAWDIEIQFRQLASEYSHHHDEKNDPPLRRDPKTDINNRKSSLARSSTHTSLTVLVFSVLMAASLIQPENSWSAEEPVDSASTVEAMEASATKEAIITILEREEFNRIETKTGWRFKQDAADLESNQIPEWLILAIKKIVKLIATITGGDGFMDNPMAYVELILWLLGVSLILLIIYRYRTSFRQFFQHSPQPTIEAEKPETLFGLDVRKENIPEHVADAVQQLWASGEYREAVGLLYRSLLSVLLHQHECQFRDSHTEGECVAIARQQVDARLSDYTEKVTLIWQAIAYGHTLPPEGEIKQLCLQWQENFPDA